MNKIILLFLLFPLVTLTSQEAFDILDHQVEITVSADGTFRVHEIKDLNFKKKRRGIIQKIPYRYLVKGKNYDIDISNVHVKDHKFRESKKRGKLELKIGDANKYVNGNQRYEFYYNVNGAISRYADHDEFYWNVIGFDTEAITEKASFSIHFPAAWADSLNNFKAFAGANGSTTADINISKDKATISGSIPQPLRANEGITIAIQLPKGIIPDSGLSKKTVSSSNSNTRQKREPHPLAKWIIGIPIAAGGLLLMLWNLLIRKTEDYSNIELQHYPPDDMTPAEVGTFYDHKVNRRDIIAILPYWGQKGYIKMQPLDGDEHEIYFEKISSLPADRPKYEHEYFNSLFDNRKGVLLSDLKDSFYTTMAKVARSMNKEVRQMGLYEEESRKYLKFGTLAILGSILIVVGILIMVIVHSILAGIGTIIVGMAAIVLQFSSPRLSNKGIDYHRHLRGLYQWLKNPDSNMMNDIVKDNPSYLHDIFPYVLAFGLDKSWDKKIKSIEMDAPIWYDTHRSTRYDDGRSYRQFTQDFQPHKIEQVFYSAPAPAPSSSGSSGGGFSGGSAGGGFGGGGTSSW